MQYFIEQQQFNVVVTLLVSPTTLLNIELG